MARTKTPKSMARAREAARLVEDVERTKDELRADARARLGVTGERGEAPPLRATLERYGVGLYPLIAVSALAIADTFYSYAFAVLAPDISRALGVSKGAIAGVVGIRQLAISIGPLPIAWLVQHRARRAFIAVFTAVVWSLAAMWTGFVVAVWGLLIALLLDGMTTGSVTALHRPLLMDVYPPEARVRAMSAYGAADSVAQVAAPLVIALLAGVLAFTWRGVFVAMGLVSLGATLVALRLRDPGFGRWDEGQIRDTVHQQHEEDDVAIDGSAVKLGFFETVRRVMMIPSLRRLYLVQAVFGFFLIPFQTFLFFFLEERWGVGPGGRALFFSMLAGAGILGLWLFAKRGEAVFRENPGKMISLTVAVIVIQLLMVVGAALAPSFGVMLVLFAIAGATSPVIQVTLFMGMLAVIPSQSRPHAAAMAGIFTGVGGIVGALFLSGIDSRFGIVGSMVSLLIPGLIGSAILYTTRNLIPRDLDRMIDEVIEDEEIRHLQRSGARLPMLACRGVDFSYGQVQVLFDVDFTVDDGEMVALLGVNGAGKSTLLRVISGLGLPSAGTVRFRGADITYLDAERRLRLGITQIPGGRSIFRPLSVVDNLRAFGYTISRDRAALEAAIDRCFDAFPRLAERRNQAASTLSGGEQQMLGLTKAFILRPKLLLIDELSLGLAPVIVEQMLEMVRRINADGTAVVLVEQSANIALSLVGHAYFMEKGEIRFDGTSRDLLAREDLLRAVFLEGVGKSR
jgi:ABC-type branched-subunit amino acid transport system ATPase component/MFS family permease